MIDLHTHILPHFDDGARSPTQALAMARLAAADGITHLAATPHLDSLLGFERRVRALARAAGDLQAQLDAAGVAVTIVPGAELHMAGVLVEKVERGSPLTIGGLGRHLLLEPPFDALPRESLRWVKRLVKRGITPIIAHPERCAAIREQPRLMEELAAAGALAQVNGDSLLLAAGDPTRATAELLLTGGLAQFIASDAHDPRDRPPVLSPAAAAAAALLGHESARRLVLDNPRLVIQGGNVLAQAVCSPKPVGRRDAQ